jgi:hypothetical protein
MVLWYYGIMVLWYYIIMVLWYYGINTFYYFNNYIYSLYNYYSCIKGLICLSIYWVITYCLPQPISRG